MSVSTHDIKSVGELMFWLKGVDPKTPIFPARDNPAGTVSIELHWAGSPDKTHFIRIGEARDE